MQNLTQEQASVGLNDVQKFFMNAGLSSASMVLGAATGGGAYIYNQGLGAGSQAAQDALEKGGDYGQAAATGTAAAAAATLMEKVGIDNIFGAVGELGINGSTAKNIAKAFLKSAASEGMEEAGEEVVNIVADMLVMGDKSDVQQFLNDYINNNQNSTKAQQDAALAMYVFSRIGQNALAGAITGGAFGGATMLGAYGDYGTAATAEDVKSLYRESAKENGIDLTGKSEKEIAVGAAQELITQAYSKEAKKAVATAQKQIEIKHEVSDAALTNLFNTVMSDKNRTAAQKAADADAYINAGTDFYLNNTVEETISTPVLDKYAGRQNVDAILGRTYETNMPVLESLAGKDAVLRAGGEEIDKADLNNLKVDTIWNKDYKANADRIATKNGVSLSENNTENQKYEMVSDKQVANETSDIRAMNKNHPSNQMRIGSFELEGVAKTQQQMVAIKAMEHLSKLIETDFYVFESYVNENGKRVYKDLEGVEHSAPNGWFDYKDNSFHIDLNAGNKGQGLMLYTISHELTHFIKKWSPAKFEVLSNFLVDQIGTDTVEYLVAKQIEKAANYERTLTYDEALEEMIADSMETMLSSGNVMEILAELKKRDQTLWQKIMDFFKDFADRLKELVDAYKNARPDSVEGNLVADMKSVIGKIEELFADGIYEASENYQNTAVSFDAETQSAAPMRSERTWTESEYVQMREKTAKNLSNDLNISLAEAYKYIDDINSVAALIADDRVRLDYEPNIDASATVIKPNSEYKFTVDMSTLCAKRLLTTGTFDAIQKQLPNKVFTSEDIVALREMMQNRGYEVACGICYVESTRRDMGRITQDFINSYKESQKTGKPITRINSNGKVVDLVKTEAEKKSTTDKTSDKFYADKNYTPTLADLNTTDIDLVKRDHPLVYEAYLNFMNARGQAKPKLLETRTEYKGEILKHFKRKNSVASRNAAGGLRLQSFSDFEVPHMIDMMQIVMDMSRVGLKSQAYTKVPAFAEVFGNTGVKINLSLIPKGSGLDADGNLIFDDVEGMNHKEAFKLREKFSKNVGTILVGKNDAHIIAAMADPRIDFIIPFHKSSWKESLYESLGLTGYEDFTDTQNEKYIDKSRGKIKNFDPSEYWDFSKSGDENAQIYLKKCREDGRIPKFPQFQGYEGYWKLLIDFKMYDNNGVGSPQEVVRPTFEMDAAEEILSEYKGGHRSFPVAKDVVEDFVKQHKVSGEETFYDSGANGVKYSERVTDKKTLDFLNNQETITTQSPRQTLDEMARQYGTIKPGETPVRESNLPKKTSKDRFLSQFARTLYESGSTTEEMLPALESKLTAGDFSYEKIKNSRLASIAQKTVAEGMDSAQKIWDGVVENSAMPKADDIALGQTLYNEYVKNGDYDSAIKIASELAVEATRLGQSVQAFRLLKKLTPDGQLYVLERTKNNIQKELIKKMGDKAPDITIDETLAENLLRAKTPQEIESAVDAIKQNIADQMPATFADKLNAWRYLAMLGNPRTHIRNIAGNTIFIPMRAFKNLIGAGLEKAGKLEQSKRTKTVLNPIKDKAYIEAGKKSFETVKDILQGTDKYGDRDIYNRRQIFKNRFLETARKLNSKALELEDVIFMKSAYVNSYAQAMKARGLTSETMTTKQESEISEYAIQEALKATYRDFNGLASALNRIKNSNKATKIIGEGLMPFTTTPLNILKRGVEYSPVGVANGVYEVLHDVKNGVKTPAEAIDTISSGLSGTAIMAVGVVLSALGLITSGGGDDEGEDALNKLTGGQNYAIEIGGHSYTIDWAAPTVLPLFIGVELERTLFEGNPGGSIKNILDSITKISDPLFNLSMLSSINSAIEAAKYSEGVPLTDIAINIATSYAGQFIPTVFGQFARISDDTVRRTYYDKNSQLPKAVDSFVQGAMKKIPGLNFLLQPSVDRWGREIKSGSIGERISENLVSPGYYSKRNFTNVDVEIDRLYKQIGESAVIPPIPEKYFTVDGERKDLSASEYTQYSKLLGQGCYTAAEQTVNNPEYAKLSDREKSAAIQEAYKYAKQTAKASISGYTVDNWVSELNKSGVNKGLYFSIKAKTSGIESNKDAQGNTIENSKSLKIKDVIDNTTSNEANKKKLYDLFGVNKKVASGYVTWDDANKPKLSNDNKTQIRQAAGYDIPEYKTETLEKIQNIGVSVEDYAYIDDRIAAYGDKVGYIKSFGFNDKQTSGLVQSLVMGKSAKDKMRVANEEYGISNNDYIRTYMAGYSSVGSKSERNAQIRSFVDSLPGLTGDQKDILYKYNAVSRGKYDSEKEKSGSSGRKRSSGKRSSSRKKTVPNLSVPGVKNVSISKTRSDLVRSAMQNYMKQKQQSDLKAAYKAQLDEIDKNPFMTQKIRAAQKAKIKERFGIN